MKRPTPAQIAAIRPTLREYLVANMLDGDDGGNLTMTASVLMDEVCGLVALWFIEASGAARDVEAYYDS